MKDINILTNEEIILAEDCLQEALNLGAEQVRINLYKNISNLTGTLNGDIEKTERCLDRILSIEIFIDNKYGSFSTNRLQEDELHKFIVKSIEMTKVLAKDECRKLPAPSRIAKDAITGREMELFDEKIAEITNEKQREIALEASYFETGKDGLPGFENVCLISEEGEYSDNVCDMLLIDSNGTKCRHSFTSFEYGVEATVQGADGEKASGFWWDATSFADELDWKSCAKIAAERAAKHLKAGKAETGKYTMIVSRDSASKLVSPLLQALNSYALQQNNSFLNDSLNKKIFSDKLTIRETCREKGKAGSRLFDSEGVATKEMPIIENGVIRTYFTNTYMAEKTGFTPTIEDYIRPEVVCDVINEKFGYSEMMREFKSGIFVTGFNGGNHNSATGDFSYGVEGFLFENGNITRPVHEMVITGNFKTLWNNLEAVGNDYRTCTKRSIPSIAFSDVDFSA